MVLWHSTPILLVCTVLAGSVGAETYVSIVCCFTEHRTNEKFRSGTFSDAFSIWQNMHTTIMIINIYMLEVQEQYGTVTPSSFFCSRCRLHEQRHILGSCCPATCKLRAGDEQLGVSLCVLLISLCTVFTPNQYASHICYQLLSYDIFNHFNNLYELYVYLMYSLYHLGL
jgi:hypothetical protein